MKDLKNLRVAASSFSRFLALIIFRHMSVKITPTFIKDALWFVSRGNQDLPVTTMALQLQPSIFRQEERKIINTGLEVLHRCKNLNRVNHLHLSGFCSKIVPILYGFQRLNISTIRNISIDRLIDYDRAIRLRRDSGLYNLLSRLEHFEVHIVKSYHDRFLKWVLGPGNAPNLKTIKFSMSKPCPFPSQARPLIGLHLGMSGIISSTLRSLTIDHYLITIAFFYLNVLRPSEGLLEIILDGVYLMPQDATNVEANNYVPTIWTGDDWESALERLDMEYRDTDCVVTIKRPKAPTWSRGSKCWIWAQVFGLPSTPPHIMVEPATAEG